MFCHASVWIESHCTPTHPTDGCIDCCIMHSNGACANPDQLGDSGGGVGCMKCTYMYGLHGYCVYT